jgi:hypothetical protein
VVPLIWLAAMASCHSVNRHRWLELFQCDEPIWKDEDHPELEAAAAAWVRKMRVETEVRIK